MPQFRWPELHHDHSLAREVASTRPSKSADWDKIAGTLSALFSTEDKPVELKGRGCRERLERLLDNFKSDDAKSLKRSGTEEDYTELTQLLEDIYTYRRDVLTVLNKAKQEKQKKEQDDKSKAEEMRQLAIETLSQRKRKASRSTESSLLSNSDEDDMEMVEEVSGKGKRKRASKLSVIDLLETKFERKAQLKEKELEIRKMELELQKKRMDQDEEERKRAQEERQKRFELELAEKKSMLELIQKLASNK